MDANNSMVNKQISKMDEKTSINEINSRKENSMLDSKQKIKTKAKHSQFTLSCKNNPNIKFELNDEELSLHIISCDDCLKELFLYQARQKKIEKEILNDKKSGNNHYKKNKNKKFDINNSMSMRPEDINNISDDENRSNSNSENEDENNELGSTMFNLNNTNQNGKKKEKRKNQINNSLDEGDNVNGDSEGNEDENDNDNDLLAQSLFNAKKVEKKVKKKTKKNKKNKGKEKISEGESEENSNDENDFEDLFINTKKKKKNGDDKKEKSTKKKNDEDDDDNDDDELNV